MLLVTLFGPCCLYTATKGLSPNGDVLSKTLKQQADSFMDTPLSESSVSFKLAEIRRRCGELMDESDDSPELTLAEADPIDDDRYTLQR